MTAPGSRQGKVPLQTLRDWAQSTDPVLNQLAFHTAFEHPSDVDDLGARERLEICLRFLERALAREYGDSIPDGPYVLAHTTLGWLRQLAASGDRAARDELDAIIAMLERVARRGDAATRDVIVLGILEHALAEPGTGALFRQWADDPELAPLYHEAESLAT